MSANFVNSLFRGVHVRVRRLDAHWVQYARWHWLFNGSSMYSALMDVTHFMQRRRGLLAALACAAALPLSGLAAPKKSEATVPELTSPAEDTETQLFLTLTSRTRSADDIDALLHAAVLPALAPSGIAQVWGPVFGTTQVWIELDPTLLDQRGLQVEQALPLLATAMQGTVMPMPGRHATEAWVVQRHDASRAIDPQQVLLALPDDAEAPLAMISSRIYSVAPPAWDGQATVTVLLASKTLTPMAFEQHCTELLAAAGDALPDDLEIQLGRISSPLKTVPSVYVSVLQEADVPDFGCCDDAAPKDGP